MSAIANTIYGKAYPEAQVLAAKLVKGNALTQVEADEILAAHPGKDARDGPDEVDDEPGYGSKEEVLEALKAGEIEVEEASKLLVAFESKSASNGTLSVKVSEKGAFSVYGLQRMPVTLYDEQWDRLDKFMETLRDYRNAHRRDPAVVAATKAKAAKKAK